MTDEYFTGNRSQVNYGKEASGSYGTAITGANVDGYLGLLLGLDPTKNDLGYIEIYGLDSDTKDINQNFETTERYGGTLRLRPQHGVPFQYAYNGTSGATYTNYTDTVKFHSMANLFDREDFDLASITLEAYKVHSTAASSYKQVYAGVKFNTLELTIDKGTPLCELSIDFDAQSMTPGTGSAPAFESSLSQLKKYNAKSISPALRPYMWKDLFVEIHRPGTGNQVVTGITSCRVKVDNELLVDYTCDATNSGQIAEPVCQRRKHEIEITARMKENTYSDYWKELRALDAINPDLAADVCELDGDFSNSDTTVKIDTGLGAAQLTGDIPSLGIMEIGSTVSEYVAFYDVNNTTDATAHTLEIARGLFGSSAQDPDDADPCRILGNVTVALNKGASAINSTGSATQGLDKDEAEDVLVFTGWDCRVTTFSSPIDLGQGMVEQTFLIRPVHLVPWTMDAIEKDYLATS